MNTAIEGHTVQRYDGELNNLCLIVLEMGGLVMDQTRTALEALHRKDLDAARRVIDRDHQVNELELRADEEVVSIIARRAPVAKDLRAIIAISKTITDLERIGDEAAKVAGFVLSVFDNDSADPSEHLLRDIGTVGKMALRLQKEALEAFDKLDLEKAEQLALGYSDLDQEFQSGIRRLATFIMEDSRNVGHVVNIVLILKALERIGGHARNIAEYVIYLVRGEDVRHQSRDEAGEGRNQGSFPYTDEDEG